MFKKAFIFLVIQPIFSQEQVRKVTLEEFIKTACSKDTVFREILIDELALKYRKALTIPSGDIVLSVEDKYNVFLETKEAESQDTVTDCHCPFSILPRSIGPVPAIIFPVSVSTQAE